MKIEKRSQFYKFYIITVVYLTSDTRFYDTQKKVTACKIDQVDMGLMSADLV